METESRDSQAQHGGGLVGSLRRLVNTLLAVVWTRLELLSTEITEERLNLARMAVMALGALFCLQVAVILAVLYFVLSVGESDRVTAIGIAALALLLAGLAIALWLWRWLKTRPPFFGATIAELRKDRERMGGGR